ncbi:hypothetical protein M9H77_31054 [Catharanthus roseus]|uniref:Uncharacterized protein n=1 Tax=Catharanthus roseus TaxID=4058 RepID=A0ACC0A1N4_CATRO|nr:hypothetical protein M9H77_31054 [Catharanthus roseus]
MYEVRTVRYQLDWMTTAQYTSPCDEWGLEAYKKRREATQQNWLQGMVARGPISIRASLALSLSSRRRRARPLHSQICMSYYISKRDSQISGAEGEHETPSY